MRAWGLWSSHNATVYGNWDLLQVFLDEDVAMQVKAGLIGKQANQRGGPYLWHEDPDGDEMFDDLHVISLQVA